MQFKDSLTIYDTALHCCLPVPFEKMLMPAETRKLRVAHKKGLLRCASEQRDGLRQQQQQQ
jgi:hypothetical protein